MPPKKDDKKKQEDPLEAKYLDEIRNLERAKNDMQVEDAFLADKFRQLKAECERLQAEVDNGRARLKNVADDYADILDHRQEQIKAEEVKLRSMQAAAERQEAEMSRLHDEMRALREQNLAQAQKLEETSAVLSDKDKLEDAVRKQHDLIEKQSDELKALKRQLEERDGELGKAKGSIEELTLKSNASTELKILFEEPWLVTVSHSRLKGDIPLDREFNSLCALASGKLLALYGGSSRNATPAHEAVGREVAVLNMESMTWDKPGTARTMLPTYSHAAVAVGRTKMLVLGGVKGESSSTEIATLNIDTMKWIVPQIKGMDRPRPRQGHAACAIREKVFMFGGLSAEGALLNDLWIYDQDSMNWTFVTCFGNLPVPRKGATLSATEDGRRLYLFGGNDGDRALNDVHFLELEKLIWTALPIHMGNQPEPREDHVACILSKYLIVSGGTTQGGSKRLGDVQVLDLYSPRWECLDEGSYASSLPWLRSRAVYTCFFGNKLFTVKPSMHEKLWELQVMELALPEDIERLRHSKKRDMGLSEKLELADEVVATVNSLELSWRPPHKNAERIDKYKLMIATSTGVVKDVYQGKDQRFRITGLKANTEYILCVKAIYDDGSFLWSESKAYMTKMQWITLRA